jgi:proton-dependent oligopeptide transporter, POT family
VVLFVTELWERFAFYGVRALLILFLIDSTRGGLGWSWEQASQLYGWYNGLVYLTPVAGGWVADRFLGANRSLALGGAVIAVGYFTMALGPEWAFFTGMAAIVLGTGLFKPNVYTMVGLLYTPGDIRRDPGFTLYYMGINLGALFGPLVCAWVAADPRLGWRWSFGVAGLGMLVGLCFYLWTRGQRLTGIGFPLRSAELGPSAAPGGRAILTRAERQRILALAIITVFVVFFWLAFEQIGSSLNLFAAQRTDREVGGWVAGLVPNAEIPAAWFQAVNPLFVLLLAAPMARLGRAWAPRPRAPRPRWRWV